MRGEGFDFFHGEKAGQANLAVGMVLRDFSVAQYLLIRLSGIVHPVKNYPIYLLGLSIP